MSQEPRSRGNRSTKHINLFGRGITKTLLKRKRGGFGPSVDDEIMVQQRKEEMDQWLQQRKEEIEQWLQQRREEMEQWLQQRMEGMDERFQQKMEKRLKEKFETLRQELVFDILPNLQRLYSGQVDPDMFATLLSARSSGESSSAPQVLLGFVFLEEVKSLVFVARIFPVRLFCVSNCIEAMVILLELGKMASIVSIAINNFFLAAWRSILLKIKVNHMYKDDTVSRGEPAL